jgi:hypothetical protein
MHFDTGDVLQFLRCPRHALGAAASEHKIHTITSRWLLGALKSDAAVTACNLQKRNYPLLTMSTTGKMGPGIARPARTRATFAPAILSLLREEARNGYQIMQDIKQRVLLDRISLLFVLRIVGVQGAS